jgi:ribonuclease Z
MALQGREEHLRLFGPVGAGDVLDTAIHLGVERTQFPVTIQELKPGESVSFDEYDVEPFPVKHGTAALGYALREHPRLGRFDVERARALGIPEGRLFGRLHRGEEVEVDGRIIRPDEVVGESRPGRLVVYTGDTRPSPETMAVAQGADLLIHEATFLEDEADRAHETFHSTARGAALVARDAGVDRLILTHVSARYSENPSPLLEEAKTVFSATSVAQDGTSIELGYRSDPELPGTGPLPGEEGSEDG